MAGFTNKGKAETLSWALRNIKVDGVTAIPTNLYIALCINTGFPVTDLLRADLNTFSEVTEITAGNGYTAGGIILARNVTDFDTATEDDTLNHGLVQLKDIVWTASGGPIPLSGLGARWAILTDDNVTQGSREIYAWWDLVSDRTVSDGQPLTLQDCTLRLDQV